MFVALLPFSTSFSGDFPGVPIGAMVFETNLFAIGMGMFFHWFYATHDHRLVDLTLDPEYIRAARYNNLMVPVVSLVGIAIALTGATWSTAIYLILPIVGYIVPRLIR
jgi:uncharacterized membrane protein